jgi:hypothetical protein
MNVGQGILKLILIVDKIILLLKIADLNLGMK